MQGVREIFWRVGHLYSHRGTWGCGAKGLWSGNEVGSGNCCVCIYKYTGMCIIITCLIFFPFTICYLMYMYRDSHTLSNFKCKIWSLIFSIWMNPIFQWLKINCLKSKNCQYPLQCYCDYSNCWNVKAYSFFLSIDSENLYGCARVFGRNACAELVKFSCTDRSKCSWFCLCEKHLEVVIEKFDLMCCNIA